MIFAIYRLAKFREDMTNGVGVLPKSLPDAKNAVSPYLSICSGLYYRYGIVRKTLWRSCR